MPTYPASSKLAGPLAAARRAAWHLGTSPPFPPLHTTSAIGGEYDLVRTSRTVGVPFISHEVASRTIRHKRRPLLPPGVIAQGTPRYALLLRGAYPSNLVLTPWYPHPSIRPLNPPT